MPDGANSGADDDANDNTTSGEGCTELVVTFFLSFRLINDNDNRGDADGTDADTRRLLEPSLTE